MGTAIIEHPRVEFDGEDGDGGEHSEGDKGKVDSFGDGGGGGDVFTLLMPLFVHG